MMEEIFVLIEESYSFIMSTVHSRWIGFGRYKLSAGLFHVCFISDFLMLKIYKQKICANLVL